MHKFYDVVVVGGGPAGSMAALEIAKAGNSVCVLEKTRDIGYPVRCGEAIGYTGLHQFIKPKKTWIASHIKSICLVSPSNQSVKINFKKETGYILNRRIFDYDLSNEASKHGAEIYTKSYVKGLIKKDGFIKGVKFDYLGQEKTINSNIVIGADGIESRVGRWAGIRTNTKLKDMESCLQYTVSNVNVPQDEMKMYVGKKYAPGGYLWIFPKSDGMANIGIGISGIYSKYKTAKEYLDDFMKTNFPNASILTSVCGGVICDSPIKNPIADGLLLVGDAAHQTNPMTGGGIASGMKGGQIAGRVATEAIMKGDYSKSFLERYPKNLFKGFGKDYNRLYKIKETINKLEDEDLNSIADSVSSIPLNKRSLSSIFKKAVVKKPSLLIDVLKVFSGF